MKYIVKGAKFNPILSKFQHVTVTRDDYTSACSAKFHMMACGYAVKMSIKPELKDHFDLPNPSLNKSSK